MNKKKNTNIYVIVGLVLSFFMWLFLREVFQSVFSCSDDDANAFSAIVCMLIFFALAGWYNSRKTIK